MRALLAALSMLAAGVAAAALLSGTASAPAMSENIWRLAPSQVHGPSLAIGAGVGFVLAHALAVSWRQLPQRALAWVLDNRRQFRWLGYGAAFVAVLMFY
jgi:hypothetical protein